MILGLAPSALVNALGGVAFILLGAWVALVGRGARANLAFTLFASAFGLVFVLDNTLAPFSANEGGGGWHLLRDASMLAAAGGLVGVAVAFPAPLAPEERRPTFALGILGGAWALLFALPLLVGASSAFAFKWIAYSLFHATSWAAVALLAFRSERAARAGRSTRSFALLGAGLAAYPAFAAIHHAHWNLQSGLAFPLSAAHTVLLLLPLPATAMLWALQARSMGRAAVATSWSILVVGLASYLLYVRSGSETFGWGIARAASVALLAYGILRHQLLGIDVKVRWTISRSTIAAAFVAVFFFASEGAQILFGQENEIVGLLAAGALVFALAPLQRAADRFAERAVPSSGMPLAPPQATDNEDVYRNALRLALRDRALTRDEERHLFRLARSLHIDAHRAHELLVEVEREAAG